MHLHNTYTVNNANLQDKFICDHRNDLSGKYIFDCQLGFSRPDVNIIGIGAEVLIFLICIIYSAIIVIFLKLYSYLIPFAPLTKLLLQSADKIGRRKWPIRHHGCRVVVAPTEQIIGRHYRHIITSPQSAAILVIVHKQ